MHQVLRTANTVEDFPLLMGLYWGHIRVILGLYWGYIWVILGLYGGYMGVILAPKSPAGAVLIRHWPSASSSSSCVMLAGFGIMKAVTSCSKFWVAVEELKLSYHNGYT